mmetsp:Transcript_20935/g.41787  ORF Transcript_20935/g.41787 Transcript_20935/m.41787 type:complete len:91 (+) Transcript_20935:2694-2966(+)
MIEQRQEQEERSTLLLRAGWMMTSSSRISPVDRLIDRMGVFSLFLSLCLCHVMLVWSVYKKGGRTFLRRNKSMQGGVDQARKVSEKTSAW